MPKRELTDAEAQRKAAQLAPIQVRGLPEPDYPNRIIASVMRDRFERGLFEPGDEFPSITVIMTITVPNVAKNTARAALAALQEEGYIKTLPGLGTSVLPREKWGTTPEQRGE